MVWLSRPRLQRRGSSWLRSAGATRLLSMAPRGVHYSFYSLEYEINRQQGPVAGTPVGIFWGRSTVRWSNFDPRDPKMGVFLESTEATPCGHLLKWKLTPENPPVDTMFMAAIAMVLPWKIVEGCQSFVKKIYETLTLTFKICILQENGFKELALVLFESLF